MFTSDKFLDVSKVTSFHQVRGSTLAQQQQVVRSRFEQGTFRFYKNGNFSFDTSAPKHTGLFPVEGTWKQVGKVVKFEAQSSASTITNVSTYSIAGKVSINGSAYSIDLATGSSSTGAAVVNDGAYGANFSSIYEVGLIAK